MVEEGDFAVTAFEGFENGNAIPGTKMEDRLVHVATGVLAHGLDEVLRGAQMGVEVQKSRSYPEDYTEKDIAGKTVEWHATVKEIFTRVLPEMDDEFAKDQGQYQNLGELRAAVREGLEKQAQQRSGRTGASGIARSDRGAQPGRSTRVPGRARSAGARGRNRDGARIRGYPA